MEEENEEYEEEFGEVHIFIQLIMTLFPLNIFLI